ncbi:SCO7613 C-terminal domain-containing membrane protein [Lacisediminihabitans sp. H27-G8]|uniref:SCO7613 C-terminal domain-containing membrane protein n=1 Tax=Lacisediminihabitans sp. H27-G8 TaxID=3111909 RepID=UPI0038FD2B56
MAETGPPSARGAGGGTPTGLDLRRFAGRVLFPRTPADLTDTTRCPACFSSLVGGACQDCRLDLSHPAAVEIVALSQQSAELLDRRLEVIGRIRYDTGQAILALEEQREEKERARDDVPVFSAAATDPFSALISTPLPPAARAGSVPAAIRGTTRPEPTPPEGANPQTADPGAPAPRRSSVQVLLLIVGISLLSVAAIFFLVYAFINFGILGRSLVIAGVTIASFVVASTLRRRSLTSTAEGIAVLAVVLVYLDAFAIRANDFFSLGSTDVTAFWGATLLVTAAGFLAWHRFSGLRTAHLIGFVAIVPGTALLVGALADGADDGTRIFVAFAAAALAGVAHRFTGRPATATRAAFSGRAERLMVVGFTGGALVGALVAAATLAPGQPWASTPAFLVVAAIAALQARLVGSDPRTPAVPSTAVSAAVSATVGASVFAAVGGVGAAVAVAAGALRFGELTAVVILAPVWAVLVTLAGEWLWRRSRHSPSAAIAHRRSLVVATISAGTVAAIALLYPLGVTISSVVGAVSRSISSAWALGPNDEVFRATNLDALAVTALVACGLMTAAAWAAGGSVRSRDSILGGFAAFVLVVAVPLAVTVAPVVTAWLVIAAAALTGLLLSHRYRRGARLRAPAMVLLAVSGVLGYVVSWGSTSTWWIGSLAAVALLLASRLLPGSALGRATAAGTAAIIVLIGSAAAARQLALPFQPDSPVDSSNTLRFVGCAATVLIGVSAFRLTAGFSRLDRRVVFWVGLAAATASFGVLALSLWSLSASERMSLLLPEPGTSLAASAALLAALLLVALRPPGRGLPASGSGVSGTAVSGLAVERVVASIALSPVLSLVVDSFARVIGLPELVRSVGPITAALFAAVGILVVAARRVRPSTLAAEKLAVENLAAEGTNAVPNRNRWLGRRWARELGVLLVAVPSVVVGVARQDSVTWLVLLVAALDALVLATSPDGLVGSVSPRRHIGWVSLALATAGLWWQLVSAGITNLEPYVLPLSGVLLLVALSVWRATPVMTASGPSLVAPAITLVALLGSILPLAASGATGPPLRALLTGGISAALLLVGGIFRGSTASRPYLDSIGLAGALGVITVEVGRSTSLLTQPGAPDIRLDGLLTAGLVLLLVAGIGQARDRGDYSAAWRSVVSQLLGLFGLVILLTFELAALDATSLGGIRAVGVILLLCAVHVVAVLLRRAPFTHAVAWMAIAGAAVAGIGALVTGAVDVVEIASVPVAVALILTGAITLSRVPTARTWPWLAPGIAALLLPSLIATAGQPPLWRLVGLGVVAVAIIVVSAILRLQAPFLIAVVIVLVHAGATFAPQIRVIYESVEWWLWFVPVGIAVVVFAARFEKSVLGMKSVAMRIRALR